MKNVLCAIICVCIGIWCCNVSATPVYTGETYADYEQGGFPSTNNTGYYIWSNNSERTNWSIRWTGYNTNENWFGFVEFIGNDLSSLSAIEWDMEDGIQPQYINLSPYGVDIENVYYSATSGQDWDGFDFSITNLDDDGRIRFNLGGSYYYDLSINDSVDGVDAYSMWIGDMNVMSVNVASTTQIYPNYLYQSFEVPTMTQTTEPVPEPGTMLLFGSGITGLALFRKRKLNI